MPPLSEPGRIRILRDVRSRLQRPQPQLISETVALLKIWVGLALGDSQGVVVVGDEGGVAVADPGRVAGFTAVGQQDQALPGQVGKGEVDDRVAGGDA